MRTAFPAWPEQKPGMKLLKGFEPGRTALTLVPLMLPAATPNQVLPAQQHQCTSKRTFAVAEPGEMMPLALRKS